MVNVKTPAADTEDAPRGEGRHKVIETVLMSQADLSGHRVFLLSQLQLQASTRDSIYASIE